MIYSTAILKQVVQQAEGVIFDKDEIRTRSSRCPYKGWMDRTEDTQNFVLTKPGIYAIIYTADITAETETQVTLELQMDGKSIAGSRSTYFVSESAQFGNVSGNVRICVEPCDKVNIELVNPIDTPTTVENVSIVIEKVA